jgi:hypothetical protein
MRFVLCLAAALALLFAAAPPAQAQAWVSHYGKEDRFDAWVPAAPTVTDTEWTDETGKVRKARRFAAERYGNTYTLIAVDYSDRPEILYRPPIDHAAAQYRAKGTVTYDEDAQVDRIPGRQLQITQADGRRIFFETHYHDGRLYILDANLAPRAAPPGQFQQTLQILDKQGVRVRYDNNGKRMERTDDLNESLGGPDLSKPILEGNKDNYIP